MTITNGYCTANDVSSRASADNTSLPESFDTDLDLAVTVASRSIDSHCGRFFYAAGSSTKVFGPERCRYDDRRGCWVADINDAVSVTSAAADVSDSGTYTAVAGSAYFTEPLNGEVEGLTGHPVTRLVFPDYTLRDYGARPVLQIVAPWGWAAVPDQVAEACKVLAVDLLHNRAVMFGIVSGDAGMMRLRNNPIVTSLLARYVRGGTGLPGIA